MADLVSFVDSTRRAGGLLVLCRAADRGASCVIYHYIWVARARTWRHARLVFFFILYVYFHNKFPFLRVPPVLPHIATI